ncbi:MAG TPA: nuclear transport factor 2 family protein [Pedobacter sp.]|jgi:hypothetical protein
MIKNIFILLFCFVITNAGFAQSKSVKEVTASVERLKEALLNGNKAALESITSKNLSYGHSSGRIEDRVLFIEALTGGKLDYVTMDISQQTVHVDGKTAVVRHKMQGELTNKGISTLFNLGVLLIFKKEKGDWKLLARQAFKL